MSQKDDTITGLTFGIDRKTMRFQSKLHVFLTSTHNIYVGYVSNMPVWCCLHHELELGVFFIWFVMLHMTFEIMIKNIVFLAIRCNLPMQVIWCSNANDSVAISIFFFPNTALCAVVLSSLHTAQPNDTHT